MVKVKPSKRGVVESIEKGGKFVDTQKQIPGEGANGGKLQWVSCSYGGA